MKRTLTFLAFALAAFGQDPVQITPYQLIDTRNGIAIPCVGCSIFTYAAGTNTPLATYTDYTLGTPNTNPVLTNSAGYAVNVSTITGIWVGSACYKFVAKDAAAVTIFTQDHICDQGLVLKALLAGATGAAQIGYQYPGGVAETVQSALRAGGALAENFCGAGGGDDSTCLATAVSAGGTIRLQARTYNLQTATLSIPSNTHVIGAGNGATVLNASAAFPAVTFLNVVNASLENVDIQSVHDGVLESATDAAHPNQNIVLRNVSVLSYGNGHNGINVNGSQCCNYFPRFYNVNVNGGSAAPAVGTRVGGNFDSSAASGAIGIYWSGGRITNAKKGLYLAKVSVGEVLGVNFDGIVDGGVGGVDIQWASGTEGVRVVGRVEAGDDKYCQFDAGSDLNSFDFPNSAAPAKCTDAGSSDQVSGGDGSGNLPDYNNRKQTFKTLAVPGIVDGEFVVGAAKATTTQLGGVGALATAAAPDAAFGYPLAFISDSGGRVGYWVSPDFDGATVGTSCALLTPKGADAIPSFTCAINGGAAAAVYVNHGNSGNKQNAVHFSNLPACAAGTAGVQILISDANTTTFYANITAGGGGGFGVAICDGTNWKFH